MAKYRLKQYGPQPTRRRSSEIRRLWGGVPPARRQLGLVKFRFWDGTAMPGGVNPLIVPALEMLDDILRKHRYQLKSLKDDWCWSRRATKGGSVWSLHSWAIAVDLNAVANPFRRVFKSDMPPAMIAEIEAITIAGVPAWTWGGRWKRRDPMHFQTNLSPAECRQTLAKPSDSGEPMTEQEQAAMDLLKAQVAKNHQLIAELQGQMVTLGAVAGDGMTIEEQVERLYQSVMGRTSDAGGLAYYAAMVRGGEQSIDGIRQILQTSAELARK